MQINVLDMFHINDFFQILFILRSIGILIGSNFWLGMYVPYVLKYGRLIILWNKVSLIGLPHIRKIGKFFYNKLYDEI